jgi:hypothetical protein
MKSQTLRAMRSDLQRKEGEKNAGQRRDLERTSGKRRTDRLQRPTIVCSREGLGRVMRRAQNCWR